LPGLAHADKDDRARGGGHERLRAAGARDVAMRDLAQIAFAFSLINRVADALEFRVPARALFAKSWPRTRDSGYRF
jgi:hypothetical protein